MKTWTKKLVVALATSGGLAAATLALLPEPLEVDAAQVSTGPLQVTVSGDGQARVRDRFTVLAPVSGHMSRVGLRPGDEVSLGQEVAQIGAALPPLLDRRSRGELEARAAAARAAKREADAAISRARAAREQAARELSRAERLAEAQVIPAQQLEEARYAERSRAEEVAAAELAAQTARREAEAARVALERFDSGGDEGEPADRVVVTAPASGRVLRVLQPNEGPIQAGTPILELGDPSSLEVVVDLLTADAVRVRPGASAVIARWGGSAPLRGTVRRVEPSAFTKISALGIEEQRVNVLIDPAPDESWRLVGDGYRVEVEVTVWEQARVLRVPSMALFRDEVGWRVYTVAEGRARLRRVEAGEQGEEATQVIAGLTQGEQVVLYPDDRLSDGARIVVGSQRAEAQLD